MKPFYINLDNSEAHSEDSSLSFNLDKYEKEEPHFENMYTIVHEAVNSPELRKESMKKKQV